MSQTQRTTGTRRSQAATKIVHAHFNHQGHQGHQGLICQTLEFWLCVLGVTSWQNLVFLTKFWPNGKHRSRARSRPRQRPRQRSPITALLELFFVTVDVAVVVDVHVNVAVDGFSFGCGFATLGPWWL